MSYKQLSSEERHYIEVERRKGESLNKIAKMLNRSQSTISREIERNKSQRGYRYQHAVKLSESRHREKRKSIKLTEGLKSCIDSYLKEDWSPEQIAGRLKSEGIVKLHHESIYRYILKDKETGGELYQRLRHQNKRYRKRYGTTNNRTGIPNRVGIEERPEVANQRQRVGDWEADTIIGKSHQGAIVTVDERKTKLRLALPLTGKQSSPLTLGLIKLLEPLKQFVLTMTFDNGKEFAEHEKIGKHLECNTYFAKPYHSWERGQNENANGLLRQYFPKAMKLVDVTVCEVFKAVDKLNSRPRKCLNFRTPYEVFKEHTGIDVKSLMGYALMS